MNVLAALVLGYLLGSVQTGLVVGRLYRRVDIREYGSGKTGFTNTLRSLGLGAAVIVLLGDVAKGIIPVLVGRFVLDDPTAAAVGAAAAVVGHTWPAFAGFRGGRGVATTLGAFIAMAPVAGVVMLALAGLILAVTRYVSLMSVTGTFAGFVVLIGMVVTGWLSPAYLLFGVLAFTFVEMNHIENIRRLLAGTEPKIGQGGARRTPERA